jgi:hypothetical protein
MKTATMESQHAISAASRRRAHSTSLDKSSLISPLVTGAMALAPLALVQVETASVQRDFTRDDRTARLLDC